MPKDAFPVSVIPSGGVLSSPPSGAISGADWLGMAMSGSGGNASRTGPMLGGGGGGGGGGRPQYFQDPEGSLTSKDERGVWQRSPASQLAERRQAFSENKFNTVWNSLQGFLGRAGNAPPGAGGGPGPAINAGPIYSPDQIQQNVNVARSQNEAKSSTQMKRQREELAGRGYGANSPLLAAMQASMNAGMMNANSEAERGIRQGAAEANAGQTLKGQTERENQFASRQSEQIQRERPWYNQVNALISAMSGLA